MNLEPICAEFGHRMIIREDTLKIGDQENVITKALGVLIENGLYAMSVYLLSCNKKVYGRNVLVCLKDLWQHQHVHLIDQVGDEPDAILTAVRKITEDLPQLVLARKITEQALVFARYHAKANVPFTG